MMHTKKMMLVPLSQSGGGYEDQVPDPLKVNPTSRPRTRRSTSDRQRKMLQVVLRLALRGSYDDRETFVSEDGHRLDIVPLLLHALTPGRSLQGIDAFIDLLYRAGVDPDMIINSDVRSRLQKRRDRGEGSSRPDQDGNQSKPRSPESPSTPHPFRYDEPETDVRAPDNDDNDDHGGGGGGGGDVTSRNSISSTHDSRWESGEHDEEDGGFLGLGNENQMEVSQPSNEPLTRRTVTSIDTGTQTLNDTSEVGVQSERETLPSVDTSTQTPAIRLPQFHSSGNQTETPAEAQQGSSETQTPNWEIEDTSATGMQENEGKQESNHTKRILRNRKESRVKSGKVNKQTKNAISFATSEKTKRRYKARHSVPSIVSEGGDDVEDESAPIRMTRSRKRRLANDSVHELGEAAKKNKNSLWNPNDSDLDDETGPERT